jgi:hypothetical protein
MTINALGATAWEGFRKRQDVLLASFTQDDGRREPLLGPPVKGNAWDGYVVQARLIEALPQGDRNRFFACFNGTASAEERAAAIAFLPAMAPRLAALRDAARCDQALFPTDFSRGAAARSALPLPSQFQPAIMAFHLSASRRCDADDLEGALDDSAASLQIALDFLHLPSLIYAQSGQNFFLPGLAILRDIVIRTDATPAQLARVERMLRLVEEQLPPLSRLLEGEAVLLRETLRQVVESGIDPNIVGLRLSAWRHGFSLRLAIADAARQFDGSIAAAAEAEGVEWPRAQALHQAAYARVIANHNPIFGVLAASMALGFDRSLRELRARLRVLHAVLLTRRGDQPPSPDWPLDPFPRTPIGRSDDGVNWRAWSAWIDGVADFKGSWKPGSGEDLLIEWRK